MWEGAHPPKQYDFLGSWNMAPFFVAEVSSSIRLIILEIKMKRDFTAGWKGTVHPCFSCCALRDEKSPINFQKFILNRIIVNLILLCPFRTEESYWNYL